MLVAQRILVLDDQQPVLRAVARALRRDGHDVVECCACKAAMAITDEVDVAVLDVELVDGRGDDVGRALLADGRARRIIFYTGMANFLSPLGLVIRKPDVDGLRAAVRQRGG